MNVKIPNSMKSPTVVIVGQGTMTGDDKSNKIHEKRMDLLERKLDEQYKRFADNKNNVRELESLQKSFIKRLDRFFAQNKNNFSNQTDRLAEALKKIGTIKREIKPNSDSNGKEIKQFIEKISSLEDAIRKITLKAKNTNVTYTAKLDGAFDKWFERLETVIKQSRPRVYPSPS